MTTQEIIAAVQAGGMLLIAGFILYQNRVLKTTIENQNTVIGNMKMLHEIFDIQKVKEYADIREYTITAKTELEKEELKKKMDAEKEEVKKKIEQLSSEIRMERDEMVMNLNERTDLAIDLLLTITTVQRTNFINENKTKYPAFFSQKVLDEFRTLETAIESISTMKLTPVSEDNIEQEKVSYKPI